MQQRGRHLHLMRHSANITLFSMECPWWTLTIIPAVGVSRKIDDKLWRNVLYDVKLWNHQRGIRNILKSPTFLFLCLSGQTRDTRNSTTPRPLKRFLIPLARRTRPRRRLTTLEKSLRMLGNYIRKDASTITNKKMFGKHTGDSQVMRTYWQIGNRLNTGTDSIMARIITPRRDGSKRFIYGKQHPRLQLGLTIDEINTVAYPTISHGLQGRTPRTPKSEMTLKHEPLAWCVYSEGRLTMS